MVKKIKEKTTDHYSGEIIDGLTPAFCHSLHGWVEGTLQLAA
jgi:hypothetical protein